MKKNILTLILLVVTVANLVLTAIMMFAVVPSAKKTDKLVTDICSVMDLELDADEKTKTDTVKMEDLEFYDAGEITVLLKDSGDDASHYAVLNVSISMDSKNKGYKKYGADIDAKISLIKNAVMTVVGEYTNETAQGKTEEMEKKILDELHEVFNSDFIYQVIISDVKIS